MTLETRLRAASRVLGDCYSILRLLYRHRPPVLSCPCCGKESRFGLYGVPLRLNSVCPSCGSLERHRLQQLLLNERPSLFRERDVLHFAPEQMLRRFLEPRCRSYVPCDYNPRGDERRVNIEDMDLPSDSFDLVVCHQVLEHVDDAKALSELRRVLRKGGVAILSTPIIEGWRRTYENPAAATPADRLRHFGQSDHVRYYGADVRDRLRAAALTFEEYTAEEPAVQTYGLQRGEKLFLCSPC